MLKVLIVDDDMLMRTSLKTLFNWENHGYTVCGEAVNGISAIAFMEHCLPDIVITDMSMPVMDGVALIGHTVRKYPQIKIIALSGYDDFEYVKQSMKKGAVDYILKHRLEAGLLLEVLETARQSILHERKEESEKQQTVQKLASAKDILRQEFINKLIMGEFNQVEEIKREIKYLELDMDTKNLVIAAAEIDDYSFIEDRYPMKDKNRLIKAFADLSGNILKESGKAFIEHTGNGSFIIVFSFGNACSNLYIYNKVFADIDRIKTSLKRYLNITASFGISKVFYDILDFNLYYFDAKLVLKDKFYYGKDKIFNEDRGEKAASNCFSLESEDEKRIIVLINSLDKQKLEDYIRNIYEEMKKKIVSYQSVQMITAELINIASKIARESGIDTAELFSGKDMPYNMLRKYDTADDIRKWTAGIFDKLIDELNEKGMNPNYSDITKKTIEFISRHYTKNLSLEDAAQHVKVNNSYLSHIFKDETGKGFVEYLNSFRIEKAKMQIRTGFTHIKDIIGELGFNNYNYFFKVFKEYVGMTPLEYEKSFTREN
jgi:two-component system response regulator YesN